MSDQELEQQVANLATELGDDHPAVKALRAERIARKAAERTVKVLGVLGQYPGSGLDPDAVEGMSLDKIEALAQRLSATAPPEQTPQVTPKPETQQTPTSAESAFERAAVIPEGKPPKVESAKKLGLTEAWALRKRNPAEYERLKAAGQIDLGVHAEDRGGSVVFHPGT